MNFLQTIDKRLKEITGSQHNLTSKDFIVKTEKKNAFLVTENNGDAELAVCLQAELLNRLHDKELPDEFALEILPDLSVVVEELSHFNFYCENALKNQELSSLDLEVQAEVDKFAYALDCLESLNSFHLRGDVFEHLFETVQLGDWVAPEHSERYYQAHEVARSFCRRVMESGDSAEDYKRQFRSFYKMPLSEKKTPNF